jgi:predicted transcriptional regulator of viral defense system
VVSKPKTIVTRSTSRSIRQDRTLADYVDRLQSNGTYVFRREDAMAALAASDIAVQHAVRRLAAKGRVVVPHRGFVAIVPQEYKRAGSPPPSWFIDALMKYHGHPYYVGLLSAAGLHGAAHQQPQEFQVITDARLRTASVGRMKLRFFLKKRLDATPTIDIKTATGTMRVSTPEATAFDLVRYVAGAGQLGNVATVLAELADKIDPKKLVRAAKADVELSVVQRTGFLLDHVGAHRATGPLAEWLAARKPNVTRLRPDRDAKHAPRDERWLVIVNEKVEADE